MTMTTDTVAPPYGAALELPVQKWLLITKAYAAFDGPFPVYVHFDDGDVRQVSSWRDVYGQVAAWLALSGRLNEPVAFPANEGRNLVARDAVHNDGRKFGLIFCLTVYGWKWPARSDCNGIWLSLCCASAGWNRLACW